SSLIAAAVHPPYFLRTTLRSRGSSSRGSSGLAVMLHSPPCFSCTDKATQTFASVPRLSPHSAQRRQSNSSTGAGLPQVGHSITRGSLVRASTSANALSANSDRRQRIGPSGERFHPG